MVSAQHMLLFISSASIRRVAIGSTSNGSSFFASAFFSNNAIRPSAVVPSASSALSYITQTSSCCRYHHLSSLSTSTRLMATDAPAEEKTDEEKAAIKAAREERK